MSPQNQLRHQPTPRTPNHGLRVITGGGEFFGWEVGRRVFHAVEGKYKSYILLTTVLPIMFFGGLHPKINSAINSANNYSQPREPVLVEI